MHSYLHSLLEEFLSLKIPAVEKTQCRKNDFTSATPVQTFHIRGEFQISYSTSQRPYRLKDSLHRTNLFVLLVTESTEITKFHIIYYGLYFC